MTNLVVLVLIQYRKLLINPLKWNIDYSIFAFISKNTLKFNLYLFYYQLEANSEWHYFIQGIKLNKCNLYQFCLRIIFHCKFGDLITFKTHVRWSKFDMQNFNVFFKCQKRRNAHTRNFHLIWFKSNSISTNQISF